jgi:RecB family exonuclease
MNYSEVEPEERTELIDILKSYQNREKHYLTKQPELAKTYHEKQFTLNFPQFYLRGTIDNIYLYEDKQLEIIDFKTNNITKDEVEEKSSEYRLQLESYCLAASNLFAVDSIKYRIEYLTPETNFNKVLKQEDIKQIEQKITDLGKKIANSTTKEDFKVKKGKNCEYCMYGKLCQPKQ